MSPSRRSSSLGRTFCWSMVGVVQSSLLDTEATKGNQDDHYTGPQAAKRCQASAIDAPSCTALHARQVCASDARLDKATAAKEAARV